MLQGSANRIIETGGAELEIKAIADGEFLKRVGSTLTSAANPLGTVTSVSVATANGFSGTVANATTTPAITIIAGAIVPTTVNGVTITTSTGTFTLASGKTFTVSNTLTFTGTDGSTVACGAGGTVAYVANKLSVFAATSSAELAGVISDETGTGLLVFGTAPVFASTITVGTAAGTTGAALFRGTTSGTVTLTVAAAAGTWTMTLPANDGDSGQFLQTNGSGVCSWAAAGGGSPGGSDTYVQFNDGGVFGGDSALVWDKTNNRLNVGASAVTANLSVKGTAVSSTIFNVDDGSSSLINASLDGSGIPSVAFAVAGLAMVFDGPNNEGRFDSIGVFYFGDISGNQNSGRFVIDDTNNRQVMSCNKPVIGNDANSGRIYRWNGNTNTYWYSELDGSGNETWTDTTDAGLP